MRYLLIACGALLSCALLAQTTRQARIGKGYVPKINADKIAVPRTLATATDTFNRADANPLTTTMSDGTSVWAAFPGDWLGMKTASNAAAHTNSTLSTAAGLVVLTPNFYADQSVSITLGSVLDLQMLFLRGNSTLTAGYAVEIDSATTIITYELGASAATAGITSPSQIKTGLSLVAGDVITATATGGSTTVINIYVNSILVDTYTDSTDAVTSGQPGIGVLQGGIGNLNEFFATDL